MLGKMLIHGAIAAAIIGSAAAVYAQAKDNGYLSPLSVQPTGGEAVAPASRDGAPRVADGYIRPQAGEAGMGERDRRGSDRHHDRHHRDHDEEDDD